MNYFFDDDSQKLIISAKKEMYDLKHPYVGSEHLFLAILHANLEITSILNSFDITYDRFRNQLIQVVGVGSKENEWFLFTPLLKRIIRNSSFYIEENGHVITPISLLISLLREGDGVAYRILISMGIDLDSVEDRLTISIHSKKTSLSILKDLGINMNEKSMSDQYDPVIGREKQVMQIIQILLRKNKNNPLLIGEAGVGKTAIIEELARRISLGNIPLKLKDKVIYSISMSNIVAGTKYRGEFEEKLNHLIEEVLNHSNIILFIDEIHTLMGAGGAEGAIDAANILKPFLARGDIKIIGATTTKEYLNTIHKDKAFDRRFQKIFIQEASMEEVKNILVELRPIYEEFHKVLLSDEVLDLFVNLSNQCLFVGKQPDKTIDFLDEVCSYVAIYRNHKDIQLSLYYKKIKELEDLRNQEILKHNFKDAINYREKEKKLKSLYHVKLKKKESQDKNIVMKEDLYRVIYQKVGLLDPIEFGKKIEKTRRKMKQLILGQNDCIDQVMNIIKKYDYISNNESMTVLLTGKKGIGKTFFVIRLVEEVFSGVNVLSIPMSEYKEAHMISKIFGTSPGYVGYQDSYLFQSIQENPFSIIILDAIEKAHPSILEQLFEAFSKGYIINGYGEKIILSKCIIFMTMTTCNKNIGFTSNSRKTSQSSIYDSVKYTVSFQDMNETMIRNYLKGRLSIIEESRKRCELIRKGLKVDWRDRGYYSICDFLEKEIV